MPELQLAGCSPTPLASYLKGLAVLRLVAEQVDPEARGAWVNESFVLFSALDQCELVAFFLDRYVPSPIISPWNGGSGFTPNKNQDGIAPLSVATGNRLQPYRRAIETAHQVRARLGITAKAEGELKEKLQLACRSLLPDDALAWFDAAIVLTSEKSSYPPLLGTGGNDGNFDFSNNFMQRILQVIDPATGGATANSANWLHGTLFAGVFHGLKSLAIGQFDPGNAGGANSSSGFEGSSLVNPWDFILMIEGALLFAAASSRRLGGTVSVLACPFSVHAVGVGYYSASGGDEDKTRNEMWMPLWTTPASLPELKALMAEGRAQVGARRVRNAVDFARAVATLGVDRGLSAFQRYAFHERNGQSYLALPLDRYPVGQNPRVELLVELDEWLEKVRGAVSSDTAPASVARAVRGLDKAVLALCRDDSRARLQEVLIALGALERTLARSLKWTQERFLTPCNLSKEWLAQAGDESPEWRLAVSIAAQRGELPVRCHLEPVGPRGVRWEDQSTEVVWHEGDPIGAMHAILGRRLLHGWHPGPGVQLGDVAAFLEGRVAPARILDLVWGLVLVEDAFFLSNLEQSDALTPALYGLLVLTLQKRMISNLAIPLDRSIFQRAAQGDGTGAAERAIRRLRASGLPVALHDLQAPSASHSKLCAAAVLFPLRPDAVATLEFNLLMPKIEEEVPVA